MYMDVSISSGGSSSGSGLDGTKLFHFHGKFKDNDLRMYVSTCTRRYVSDIMHVSINLYVF